MKEYKFLTSCKLCGESVKIPQEEHLLADDNIHVECQMDKEEYENVSPLDLPRFYFNKQKQTKL